MRRTTALCASGKLLLLGAALFGIAEPAGRARAGNETAAPAAARVEARSADFLAVGTVRGDRMTIHLSRLADNSPVRDAAVVVVLRGAGHPAVAEADGSYSVQTPDLSLSGAASVQFQVTQGATREDLQGPLQIADRHEGPKDKGTSRQIGWWVLNFAVCIGFLMLWSRRKRAES